MHCSPPLLPPLISHLLPHPLSFLKLLTQTHPWLQSHRRLPWLKGQHYQVVHVSLIITFTADKTYTLVLHLHQNVIKTGLHIYMLAMSHY